MYKLYKTPGIWSLSIVLILFFLTVFTSTVTADENDGNLPPDANMVGMMTQESIVLPFDPNDYTFLIYNPGGTQSRIVETMEILGIPCDVRDFYNEVTPNDLATHDILIVGWNDYDGDISGLDEDILSAGITGRVILSGHDLDYHTYEGLTQEIKQAAEKMLVQAIDYVLAGGGTGMITLGCIDKFPYLPEEWGVEPTISDCEIVTQFTSEGLASGVFDGLDPNDMCNWKCSYHDVFDIDPDSDFMEFELGGYSGEDAITVARLRPGYEVELTKTDSVNDGGCVGPSDEITYTISYNYPNRQDAEDINDVVIIDYLPDEVDYNAVDWETMSVDPNYDPVTHTYTWSIGTISPGDTNSVMLTVEVICPEPGSTIRNYVRMKSGNEAFNKTFEDTPVCCCPTLTTEDFFDGGCVGIGHEITYNILYDANGYGNTNVIITDDLPSQVEYVSSTPPGDYDEVSHTVTWNIGILEPNESNSVSFTVKMLNRCIPGCGIITNFCKAESGSSFLASDFEDTPVCCASNPWPTCGETIGLYIESNNVPLKWCSGPYAADSDGHNVYIGTDFNDVNEANMNVYIDTVTVPAISVNGLSQNTTYYWRIDEVNEPNIWPGPVWSFTVGDFYVIDDFEYYTVSDPIGDVDSYGDAICPYYDGNDQRIDLDNDMRYWWLDGHVQKNPQGDCGGDVPWDYNPLVVQCTVGRLPGSRIIRTDFGRTGYGMSYYYNNDNVINDDFPPEDGANEDRYSEILRYYADGVNLTLDNTIDVNLAALGVFFLGQPDNDCNSTYDRMYVVLEDTDVTISGDHKYRGDDAQINHPNPDAARRGTWQHWAVKLKEFTDKNSALDLTRVRSVRIGFGKRFNKYNETPGGEGTVIFDDIRLYPYCSQADMDSDCDVDFYDYAKLAKAWLCEPGEPNYNEQCDLDNNDSAIDCNDLALFCDDWLSGAGWNLQQSMTFGRGAGSGLGQSAYFSSISEQAEQLEQQPVEVEPADIERLLEFLEEIWLTEPQIRETISEQDWNKFIESLKDYQ